ncbi:aminotransferase class III-fold pyridoxal phosphate-dependent enzyme [Phycisphaeraceae bacterium D3-23]
MKAVHQAIENARKRYAAANPKSLAAHQAAARYLPGGNTRTVLHYEPFPLTMVGGEGAELIDLDGHRYVDFVSEFSAGLFGHSDKTIKTAISEVLDQGIVLGGPTSYERELAGLLCGRFPAIEQVRFCNSGTEANLLALTTAKMVTGREKILVFRGAYHGGVIKFSIEGSAFNVPYDFVLADYNDTEATAALIRQQGDGLAAVMVEPILGVGGNIVGSAEFMAMLRQSTQDVGAMLIFDEVKTARLGHAGMQGRLGIKPDLVTLGKIIAGGLPTGAFGGSAEIMGHYNPHTQGALNHAGTFNNNVCSMAAGCAAMGKIFTPQCADDFFDTSERFRDSLNQMFAAHRVPMFCNGLGSIFAIHFSAQPLDRIVERTDATKALNTLLHLELLLDGVLIISRGDLFLSLPMTESHFAKARSALESFVKQFKPLICDDLVAPSP